MYTASNTAVVSPKGPVSDPFRIRFQGKIIHVRRQGQVANALNYLETHKEWSKPSDAFGFDMEWRPEDHSKNEKNSIAIIQLCSSKICLLFHMLELKKMPDQLRAVLESANLQKVCHGFETSDKIRLETEFGITPRNFVDTAKLALYLGNRNFGLQSLVQKHFSPFYLDKTLAVSDWAASWLTPDQIIYAATDSWITRELFLKLIECEMQKRGTGSWPRYHVPSSWTSHPDPSRVKYGYSPVMLERPYPYRHGSCSPPYVNRTVGRGFGSPYPPRSTTQPRLHIFHPHYEDVHSPGKINTAQHHPQDRLTRYEVKKSRETFSTSENSSSIPLLPLTIDTIPTKITSSTTSSTSSTTSSTSSSASTSSTTSVSASISISTTTTVTSLTPPSKSQHTSSNFITTSTSSSSSHEIRSSHDHDLVPKPAQFDIPRSSKPVVKSVSHQFRCSSSTSSSSSSTTSSVSSSSELSQDHVTRFVVPNQTSSIEAGPKKNSTKKSPKKKHKKYKSFSKYARFISKDESQEHNNHNSQTPIKQSVTVVPQFQKSHVFQETTKAHQEKQRVVELLTQETFQSTESLSWTQARVQQFLELFEEDGQFFSIKTFLNKIELLSSKHNNNNVNIRNNHHIKGRYFDSRFYRLDLKSSPFLIFLFSLSSVLLLFLICQT